MTLMKNIQHVFPQATEIPEAHLRDIPCIQTGYLINGEIRVWGGPVRRCSRPFGWQTKTVRSLFPLVNIPC